MSSGQSGLRLTREGFGRILFYDWRYLPGERPNPEFVLNFPRYKRESVLLARANFGCGSSREHAPWGVKDYSFRVIIAPSYADIFYNNCFKNGILPATLREEHVEELFQRTEKEEGYSLTVNLPNQTIADKHGLMFKFEIPPSRKEVLVKGLDDIGTSMQHAAAPKAIARFSFTREAQGADSGADSENPRRQPAADGQRHRDLSARLARILRGLSNAFGVAGP